MKTMPRLGLLGAFMAMLALAFPADALTEGDYTYTTNDSDQATIIRFNRNYTGALTITNTLGGRSVTGIGAYAFRRCSRLISVAIPAGVISIEHYGFADCDNLAHVTIPGSVTSIGDGAFSCCYGLTRVTIPDSVTSVGREAFSSCHSLTNLTIGTGVINIGDSAFSKCFELTSVNLPASVTRVGGCAFMSCDSLTNLTIGAGVTNIGTFVFDGCFRLAGIAVDTNNSSYSSVDGVLFDKNQTTLIACPMQREGSYAIPATVTSVGVNAFSCCYGLTSVTIPATVTNIIALGNPFFSSKKLTGIAVDTNNPSYSSVDGVLFDKNQTTLIASPMQKEGSYTIPATVTSVSYDAFWGCTNLTSVTIGSGVIKWAFVPDGLTSVSRLTGIAVNASNPSYSSVDGVLFDKNQTTLIQYPADRSGTYTIPGSVTNIGDRAFLCCYGLTRVTIPASVGTIGKQAFERCTSLTGVYFRGNAPSLDNIYVFNSATNATVYYLLGTTGWDSKFGRRPTAVWTP